MRALSVDILAFYEITKVDPDKIRAIYKEDVDARFHFADSCCRGSVRTQQANRGFLSSGLEASSRES